MHPTRRTSSSCGSVPCTHVRPQAQYPGPNLHVSVGPGAKPRHGATSFKSVPWLSIL